MITLRPLLACAILLLLASCSEEGRTKSETPPKANDMVKAILFEDRMTSNWQENWFLDGQKATLEHRDGGLYFAGGTVTKKDDPKEYHSHHAVLWTKQEFEGDLLISFEMTRIDDSNYGNTLIYIQAQGIGTPPYEADIFAWRELRAVPAMDKYFNGMNLLSISLRENIRCKRYPWNDIEKNVPYKGPLIEPMYDYGGLEPGKTYRVEIEKKNPMVAFRLYDAASGNRLKECVWDVSQNTEDRKPHLIQKGRIGLRHMATKQFTYRNFKVMRLAEIHAVKASSNAQPFSEDILKAAAKYKEFKRVENAARWAPTDCRIQLADEGRFSESKDEATHGRKLSLRQPSRHICATHGYQ